MKKLLSGIIAFSMLATATVPALATGNGNGDEPKTVECGEEVVLTKSNDYNGEAVIDFQNTDSIGNPDTVSISAGAGYALVKVELNINFDNQGGYVDHTASFPGTFNPDPGWTIEVAKVTVEKICVEVCNDETASNFEETKPGESTANNELCTYPEPEPTPATPSATPETPKTLPNTGNETLFLVLGSLVVLGGAWLGIRRLTQG